MIKFHYYYYYLFLFIFFNNLRNSQSILQCYLCADCGDPFNRDYPYTTVVSNQNYGASCIKTVSTVSYGKVVSRGTTFNCMPTSTSDTKIYCCQSDFCNRSNILSYFISLLFIPIFYSIFLLLN